MEPADPHDQEAVLVDGAGGARARGGASLVALLDAIRRDLADGLYHPRERLVEADLGVTFETDGLRAHGVLRRE